MTKKNKAKDAQYQNLRAGSVNAKRPKSSGDAAPSTSVSSLPRIPKKPKPLPQKVSLELENPILDGRDDDDDFLETFLPETHKYWVDKGRELPVAIETLIFPIYWFSNDPLLPCPLGGPSLHPPGTPPRPEYDDLIPCTPECPKTPERSFCFDETGVLNASFAASVTFSPNVSHSSLTSSPSRSTAGDDSYLVFDSLDDELAHFTSTNDRSFPVFHDLNVSFADRLQTVQAEEEAEEPMDWDGVDPKMIRELNDCRKEVEHAPQTDQTSRKLLNFGLHSNTKRYVFKFHVVFRPFLTLDPFQLEGQSVVRRRRYQHLHFSVESSQRNLNQKQENQHCHLRAVGCHQRVGSFENH